MSVTGNISSGNANLGNLATANFFTGTLTTNAQPNITSVGTLTSLNVTGNVTASYFFGNGSQLTGLTAGNISGTVANANYAAYAGNVTTAAQPNITSLGTLTSLSVSGNANIGNIDTARVLASANITAPQLISNVTTGTAPFIVTSTTQVANLSVATAGSATTAGTVTTAAQPNITSVGTLTSLAVTGNISAGNVSATTFTGALSGAATTAGTVTTNAQPNITSVGTLSSLAVTGNITSGNANLGNLVSANFFTGALTTNAQPNITSVGTLTSLSVTGNITSGNANLGNLVSANFFTGNGSQLTGLTAGNISGTVANANYAAYAGNVTIAAQSNITSVGTLTSLGVNGTVTAVAFTANTGVFTGNGSGLSAIAGANVTGTVANATFATSAGSATTAGTANTTQALTIGTGLGGTSFNGGTAVTITNTGVTSIVAGTNIAISGGTGAVTVNVTGTVANATFATSAGSATTAGTVTTNAQPNITSVGTLTSVTVSGTSNLGAVGNITITGGSANYILETNGSGVLSWVAKPTSGATIADDTITNATFYPIYATATTGTLSSAGIASTKLQFNPSTGEMTATNFNSLSDEKFKTNIKPITDALEIIKKLQGVSYDWIEGGSSHGLIAQTVENIIPNVVSDNGERKTINYSAIIPFLIEAIKTQQELIDSHSLEIDKLKKIIKHILEKIEGL